MDENYKKDDSNQYFQDKNNTSSDDANKSEPDPSNEQTSHYFSYGPYRSQDRQESSGKLPYVETKATHTSYVNAEGEQQSAEISRLEPIPVLPLQQQQPQTRTNPEWSYQSKKTKSGFRSTMIAFLAGAIVVSGLMFAADRTNLFTKAEANEPVAAPSSTQPDSSGSLDDSGVRNAAMQDVVRPNNIADIVKMASPAVVKIETYVNANKQNNGILNDPFFRQFFGDRFQLAPQQNNEGEKIPAGIGSGFIFDKSGYILTNQHVIENADEIYVSIEGYKEPFKAELLGSSRDLDLAALKITGTKDFSTLKLGSSDDVEVGDWLVAIGNPYGFDHTVTVGVLSARERPIQIQDKGSARTYEHLLQTNAAINPGNSGGPLLNLNGEVIGINTAVSSEAQGIGFAIPTSTVVTVLDNLKNDIPVPKPYIGIIMRNLTEEGLKSISLDNGVGITGILEGSPAADAGIQPYDVIVEVDGAKVASSNEIAELVSKKSVGDKVSLRIYRDGKMISTGVTIGDSKKG